MVVSLPLALTGLVLAFALAVITDAIVAFALVSFLVGVVVVLLALVLISVISVMSVIASHPNLTRLKSRHSGNS